MSKPTLHLCVDVEATGPVPAQGSMVEIGIVAVGVPLEFYSKMRPKHAWPYSPETIQAMKWDLTKLHTYPSRNEAAVMLFEWLDARAEKARLVFWSDNPAFDFMWVADFLWEYGGRNPFGHSGRRIGDYYSGLMKDTKAAQGWKQYRKTPHTHNALDDARGFAEALHYLTGRGNGRQGNAGSGT